MRLLHARSTAEPVLHVSTCPPMNIFSIVTVSTLTVYRSTNLTIVLSAPLPLSSYLVSNSISPAGPDKARVDLLAQQLHSAWSPSGRLFTLSLPDGVMWTFDVEVGELVRRLVPSGHPLLCRLAQHKKEQRQRHGPSQASARAAAHEEQPLQVPLYLYDEQLEKELTAQDSSSTPSTAATEEDNKRPSAPVLALSTAVAPLAALTWTAVTHPSRQSDYAQDIYSKYCLPVPQSTSTSVLEELETRSVSTGAAASGSHTPANKYNNNSNDATTSIALLIALDVRGTVSFIVGGLMEVHVARIDLEVVLAHVGLSVGGGAVPIDLDPAKGFHVEQFCINPVVNAATPAVAATGAEAPPATRHAQEVLQRFLLALEPEQTAGGAAAASKTATEDITRSSTSSSFSSPPDEHVGLLVLRYRPGGSCSSSLFLLQLHLGSTLTTLTQSSVVSLCRLAEHSRQARYYLGAAQRHFYERTLQKIRADLKLPARAQLLREAVVETIAQPNEDELARYYKQLDREALVEDLELLREAVQHVEQLLFYRCYGYYDAAMALALAAAPPGVGLTKSSQSPSHPSAVALQRAEQSKKPKLEVWSSPATSWSAGHPPPPPSHDPNGALKQRLLSLTGALRRYGESELRRVKAQSMKEEDLLRWVLQRASLTVGWMQDLSDDEELEGGVVLDEEKGERTANEGETTATATAVAQRRQRAAQQQRQQQAARNANNNNNNNNANTNASNANGVEEEGEVSFVDTISAPLEAKQQARLLRTLCAILHECDALPSPAISNSKSSHNNNNNNNSNCLAARAEELEALQDSLELHIQLGIKLNTKNLYPAAPSSATAPPSLCLPCSGSTLAYSSFAEVVKPIGPTPVAEEASNKEGLPQEAGGAAALGAGSLRTFSCTAAPDSDREVDYMAATAAATLSCRLVTRTIGVEPPQGSTGDVLLAEEAGSDAFVASTLLPPRQEDGHAAEGQVQLCGYGFIAEDRHVVLLLRPNTDTHTTEAHKNKGEAVAGSSLVFISVDDSGALRLQEPEAEEDDKESHSAAAEANQQHSNSESHQPQDHNNEEEEEEEEEGVPQRIVVDVGRLAEGAVPRLSICSAREFAVIVVQNKLVVVDLFEM